MTINARPEGLDMATQVYDLTITNGGQDSGWVKVERSYVTGRMALDVDPGGPTAQLTFKTRPLDGGTEQDILANSSTEDLLTLNITSAGGSFGAAVLAPLASQINREWLISSNVAVASDLGITLRIS